MLRIGDIVKRPDGKRYMLIPDYVGVGDNQIKPDMTRPHDGYLMLSDAKMENLEKVGETA